MELGTWVFFFLEFGTRVLLSSGRQDRIGWLGVKVLFKTLFSDDALAQSHYVPNSWARRARLTAKKSSLSGLASTEVTVRSATRPCLHQAVVRQKQNWQVPPFHHSFLRHCAFGSFGAAHTPQAILGGVPALPPSGVPLGQLLFFQLTVKKMDPQNCQKR